MDRSEIGRQLASLRPKKEVTCPVCGKVVTGQGRRTYCSTACRVKASYERRRNAGLVRKAGDRGSDSDAKQP